VVKKKGIKLIKTIKVGLPALKVIIPSQENKFFKSELTLVKYVSSTITMKYVL